MKNKLSAHKNQSGFTLVEVLLVVVIISILSIVVLTGLKPAQRLADTRDARRAQDINQIITAIGECVIDKKDNVAMSGCLGSYTIGNTYEIVSGSVSTNCDAVCTGATSDSSCLVLDTKLSDYFTDLPVDPEVTSSGHTGYSIIVHSNGMVVVEACGAENGTIKVSR